MEKIFEQALLYDFYGELLTEHQRNVYEDAVFNDMSLAEIAEEKGISRQGVHDLIKRCDKILQDYENKLHLVERFTAAKDKIGQIVSLTEIDHTFGEIITEWTTADAVVDKGSMEKYKDYVSRMERIRTLSQELMEDW